MAKTEATLRLEVDIWEKTHEAMVFGAFEVTIGWFGRERVDYLTYDTRGTFRCYEIKVSKADFYSKARNTFCGHLNYYVLTDELYEQVKDGIPEHIGIFTGKVLRRKPKRVTPTVSVDILKDSLIRSMHRDAEKYVRLQKPTILEQKEEILRRVTAERDSYNSKLNLLERALFMKFGRHWRDEVGL